MYQYQPATGNIVDEDDGQIVATTSDNATPEQGILLAASGDLLEAVKQLLANGIDAWTSQVAQNAIEKATKVKKLS